MSLNRGAILDLFFIINRESFYPTVHQSQYVSDPQRPPYSLRPIFQLLTVAKKSRLLVTQREIPLDLVF